MSHGQEELTPEGALVSAGEEGIPRDPQRQSLQSGSSFPLGATLIDGGVNFSVFSKGSTAAQLLFFDSPEAPKPARVIDLDPLSNRTYHYWHVFVPGISAGQLYGYRVSGPFDPTRGFRFDSQKVLLDPYGKAIASPPSRTRETARQAADNVATALRSVVVDPAAYDWQADERPSR